MDMDQSQEIEVQAENFREPRAGASPHGNMRDNQVAKGTGRVQARAVQPQLEQHGRAPRPLPSGDWGQPGHRPGARPAFPEDAKSSTVDLCRLSGPQRTESTEVANPDSIKAAAAKVGEHLGGSGLNLLINNAGIIKPKTLDSETLEDMTEIYATNTAGPLLMGQAFLPLLKKAAQGSPGSGLSCSKAAIINISSIGGSFSSFFTWDVIQATSYRCSKAALNMLSKCQSLAYREHGILCVALHPGWVQTDMGSSAGHTAPREGNNRNKQRGQQDQEWPQASAKQGSDLRKGLTDVGQGQQHKHAHGSGITSQGQKGCTREERDQL